jgi:uracil-DNA glycosylase family 4
MSFFPLPEKASRQAVNVADIKLLHTLECQACPLAQVKNTNPDMPATGVDKPLIYCLGEAPGAEEDATGVQFIGGSGQILRDQLRKLMGKKYKNFVRFNNVVRTRPFKNETPTWNSIECCRPSVVKDIEQSKPKAVFGFGNIPLNWAIGSSGIMAWRGRKMPVYIGSHLCWYYAFLHPAFLLRKGFTRTEYDEEEDSPSSEDERMFRLDLQRALADLETVGPPLVHSSEYALRDIAIVDKFNSTSLGLIESELKLFGSKSAVGVDYETNALRPYKTESKVLSAAVSDGVRAIGIPFDHPGAQWSTKHRKQLGEIWCDFLATATAIKAVHNLQFEMEWTAVKFNPKLLRKGEWQCSMVQASVIDERYKGPKPGPLSLEFLVRQYFGINIKQLAGVDRGNLANTPLPHVLEYNALDARYHNLLYSVQAKRIEQMGLQHSYDLAVRRVPTLVLAQVGGMPVSQEETTKLHDKYKVRIEGLHKDVQGNAAVKKFVKKYHQKFNPLSAPDCIKMFSELLGYDECEVYDKKKKGESWKGGDGEWKNSVSAGEEVLKQINHPLADYVIRLRKAQKLQSTYIEPLMAGSRILWPDNKLHPIFNHVFTDTSRLSAEDPNVQNFPKRQDEAKEVRRSIKPPKGHVMLSIDYGQIEARVIAMYTKDKRFVKALWERYDVHGEWAERIAHAYPTRIGGRKMLTDKKAMKDFRTDIKNEWTFPLFFGAQLESVCKYLNIPIGYIAPLHREFWRQFSGIRQWQNEMKKFYDINGYVETFTGRRRNGPLSFNKVINSPVQGFTAELVMEGMCRLSETGDPLLQPQLQIHDDLTWVCVPEAKVDHVAEKALDILLSSPFDVINVPITMELSVGPNWLDMEEVGTFSSDEWGTKPIRKSKVEDM